MSNPQLPDPGSAFAARVAKIVPRKEPEEQPLPAPRSYAPVRVAPPDMFQMEYAYARGHLCDLLTAGIRGLQEVGTNLLLEDATVSVGVHNFRGESYTILNVTDSVTGLRVSQRMPTYTALNDSYAVEHLLHSLMEEPRKAVNARMQQ